VGDGPSWMSSLLAELRRRKVVRTAAGYAVAAWVVIQVATAVFPVLLVPDWLTRAVVVLALLGLPVAVALAWAFDVTPEGILRTPPDKPSIAQRARRRVTFWVVAGATAVMTGVFAFWYRHTYTDRLTAVTAHARASLPGAPSAPGPTDTSSPSIAVLPFENMSGDTANTYFSEGVTEEILNALARVPGLTVMARSSSFALAGRGLPLGEIAQRLGVDYVLEGSVRQEGSRIRITPQLDAKTGRLLWSDDYDREMRDILKLQEDIAREIADRLQVQITATNLLSPTTVDPGAYDLYLQGRALYARRNVETLPIAIALFQRAVVRDPQFAQAYGGLAMGYVALPFFSRTNPDSAYALAERSARRALALYPDLVDAHVTLAYLEALHWQWRASEAEFRKVLALDPSNATAHHWFGEMLYGSGRLGEALGEARRAAELDPLSQVDGRDLEYVLFMLRRFDEAISVGRRTFDLDTSSVVGTVALAFSHLYAGAADSAVDVMRRALHVTPGAPFLRGPAAYVFASAGRTSEARALFHQLRRDERGPGVSQLEMATAFLALGQRDSALARVAHSVVHHDPWLIDSGLACDPMFDTLKADSRFVALVARMGAHLCPAGAPPPGGWPPVAPLP
jgi:adenylate cyclase